MGTWPAQRGRMLGSGHAEILNTVVHASWFVREVGGTVEQVRGDRSLGTPGSHLLQQKKGKRFLFQCLEQHLSLLFERGAVSSGTEP